MKKKDSSTKCIARILSEMGTGRTPVKAKYAGIRIDEDDDWGRNEYFFFLQPNGKSFELQASKITDYCFKFNRSEEILVVRDCMKCLLLANEDMIIYRIGERRIYCYRYDDDSTYRIDTLSLSDALLITRAELTIKIQPERIGDEIIPPAKKKGKAAKDITITALNIRTLRRRYPPKGGK